MAYEFAPNFASNRYDKMIYRRCGKSGLELPAISLGGWQTFGGYRGEDVARECLFRAFDLGITHFDFANNYGTPPGNSEIVCGKVIKDMPRDELIISSKAGYDMYKGPYGDHGSRKYIIASCDQSLKRMGLEYFDIFYHHRPDPNTPIEETMGALNTLVDQGKALYAGVSNYNGAQFTEAALTAKYNNFAPIVVDQPSYSMLNRWIEGDLLPWTKKYGAGIMAFCPLESGLLTGKYLNGAVPAESRAGAAWGTDWLKHRLTEEVQKKLVALDAIAKQRGQSLTQLALAWLLRDPGVTSALIGASSVKQIEENVAALDNLAFTQEELDRIEEII